MLLPLYGCHAPRRRGQLLALFAAAYGLRPAGEGKQTAELMIHTRAPPFLTPEPILEPTLFNTLYHDSRGAVARLQQAHEPPARRPVLPMYSAQYWSPVVARSLKNRSDGADMVSTQVIKARQAGMFEYLRCGPSLLPSRLGNGNSGLDARVAVNGGIGDSISGSISTS